MNIFVYEIGGQTTFLEQALTSYKELLFSDINVLFYVIDVSNFWAYPHAKDYFLWALNNAKEHNKNVKTYVLAHKTDLIPEEEKQNIINQISDALGLGEITEVEIIGTSIYDVSIYKTLEDILLSK